MLGGLPVTVKSAIDVAGLRCEAGSPSRRGRVAATDAVVVARLRQAGAILLGTTNVAEMLMGYETDNPLHGLTSNPWNDSTTPGGSSGGEAVAIATGCSAGGIGSDGGGSIRVPAHFSGICGFKPTPGRWPATGTSPRASDRFRWSVSLGRWLERWAISGCSIASRADGTPRIRWRCRSLRQGSRLRGEAATASLAGALAEAGRQKAKGKKRFALRSSRTMAS